MLNPIPESVIQVLFLMLKDLSVKFIDQIIDGGVEVFLGVLGKKICSIDMDGCLRFLRQLFYAQDDVHLKNLVEVLLQSRELIEDVAANGLSDLNVVTCNFDLHDGLSVELFLN